MTFVGSAWALLTGHMSDFVLIIYLSAYLKLFIRGMWLVAKAVKGDALRDK